MLEIILNSERRFSYSSTVKSLSLSVPKFSIVNDAVTVAWTNDSANSLRETSPEPWAKICDNAPANESPQPCGVC